MKIQGFDVESFLRDYWQKKPLLIRNAIPDFSDPIEPEELAGLACEEPVESRLIFTEGESWRLQTGPFQESDFTSLPESHWTLLVQSVDQWLPDLKLLFSLVDFLPTWRRDDLLVSFATPGSGAGPHYDFYDVFILQGMGSRVWTIGQHCTPETPMNTESGLKVLENFEARESFTLESGDLLYIPPGVAHYGISVDNSLSYSLGFRAPSVADMLIGVSDELASMHTEHERYQDDPALLEGTGLISAAVLQNLGEQLIDNIRQKPEAIARWFGSLMTSPRYPEQIVPLETAFTTVQVATLAISPGISMNSFSRVAYTSGEGTNSLLVFFDGECINAKSFTLVLKLLHMLGNNPGHEPLSLSEYLADTDCMEVLMRLLLHGTLVVYEELEEEELQ